MSSIGQGCTSTVENYSKLVKGLNQTITEDDMADILILVVSKSDEVFLRSNKAGNSWNIEVIADVMSTEVQGMDWVVVLQKLDNPSFFLRSESNYQTLLWFFMRLGRSQISAVPLLKLWNNKTAQLSILTYGLHSDSLNFSDVIPLEPQLGLDVKMPKSGSWLSLSLFSILLELAASGLSIMVLEIFVHASSLFPEYVLLGFAQVIDPKTGIRAEILRRTLPLFTGLPGSFPTSHIVMNRLLEVNPDLLVLLFRIALKRSSSVEDVLIINNLLSSFNNNILKRIEDESVFEEIIGFWCVKADRFDFNLEDRLSNLLAKNPNLSRSLVFYVCNQSQNLRSRLSEGGLLSFDSLNVILRVLEQYKASIPAGDINSMKSILANYPKSSLIKYGILDAAIMEPFERKNVNEVEPANSDLESFGIEFSSQDNSHIWTQTSNDVEEESNSYFQRLYTSEISIADAIGLLKKFKHSEKLKEQEVFRCMIHNLFDEYRFFHKYPEKELIITGQIFGSLIQNQLVSSITLGIALRYILEAIKKDPEVNAGNEKNFRFGKMALEQFKSRLGEWPQYCSHLIQIPHFRKHAPELFQEAQRVGSSPASKQIGNTFNSTLFLGSSQDNPNQMLYFPVATSLETKSNDSPSLADENLDIPSTIDLKLVGEDVLSPDQDLSLNPTTGNSGSPSVVTYKDLPIIEQMVLANVDVYNGNAPPDGVRDQILFIINNIAKDNFESKTEDLRGALTRDYFNWFANYLVVKRVSTMPNLHPIYLSILDSLDSVDLFNVIIDTTYHNATKLLQSTNITTSSSERSLLRNLGIWLGQITLARNKPLLHRRMNLKKLLIWGYESARLIAVCSFVAKIIEGVKESRVFRPPNPWLMAVLGIMRELYEIEDLKMNIKFEVQVLCKNVNIRIEDIPRGNVLSTCKIPNKDSRNPDFTIKISANPASQSSPSANVIVASSVQVTPSTLPMSQSRQPEEDDKQGGDSGTSVNNASFLQEQTVIPNLASYVTINQSLTFFTANPNQRRLVPLAVDRAIREIIQPVVERSVSIANVTTKNLIVKDFYSEPNEVQLRNGAHLMISNLAGSLALVTCKEPLRISISNHLRTLLSQSNVDQATIEQIVQVCSNDNLELGCILIEKASTEKAIRDVDETLAAMVQARRKARESGQAFVDNSFDSIKFFNDLPEPLKPKSGGLNPSQYLVYETFQRQRVVPQVGQTAQQDGGNVGVAGQAIYNQAGMQPSQSSLSQNLNSLSMSQSLEAYQLIYARLDMALKTVQLQASGRDVTISMLGTDHEILGYFRDMIIVTQRTLPAVRSETAMAFCENVFKRLMESINTADSLRIEVMVGIIEALRDACGGIKKFSPDVISWLSHYATFSPNDDSSRKFHRVVLILLLRGKLIRTQELDVYFASCMDGGRNIVWVEVALLFIRQCLAEGLAATYEFANSFDTVSKMRPNNAIVRKQLQKWLTDLKAIAATKEEQKMALPSNRDTAAREHVTALLERWLRVWNSTNDQIFGQYLQLMHQYGVLKTEEAADRFFRLSTELCVEASLKTGQVASPNQLEINAIPTLTFTVIDALSKLFLLLIRLADKEAGDITVRVNLQSRILNAVARTVVEDHEMKKNSKMPFDQRPYYRLFSNLSQELGIPDSKADPNPVMIPLLTSYCQVYLAIQPSVVPGFAYSWLQLISHKTFMPHLLLIKGQKCWPHMHKLLVAHLLFLQPFLKHAQLNDSIRRLYKGTLRVLLVLLHDFPEFLCDFHLSFCDVIPPTCVQLRNLVLSAFPRTMRLPDPFTPNLKVDLLPEISQPPRILTDHMAPLIERGIRQRLDSYISTKQPADLPSILVAFIQPTGSNFSIPLLTSVIVYVGSQAILQLQTKVPLQNSPSMEIFRFLINSFDAEGRYYLFNVMANQLRYPNSHTHYFSCVLLWLFSESDSEYLQEQITRVLLERLIVHRPHPVSFYFYSHCHLINSMLTCITHSFIHSLIPIMCMHYL